MITPAWVQDARGQNLALGWTRTFSPTMANTFKVSYLRHRSDYPSTPAMKTYPPSLRLSNVTVGFGLSVGMLQFSRTISSSSRPFLHHQGKHSLKFGGEYRRIRNSSSFFFDLNGFFLPYSIEELVTDMAFGDEVDLALSGHPRSGRCIGPRIHQSCHG